MKTSYRDIRENIHIKYDEEHLKKILLNFYNQSLDSSNFNIENRNVSKILDYFFQDLIYRAKSKNGKYSPNEVLNNDQLLESALKYIEEHRNFYHNKSDITNLKDFFFSSSMVGKITNFNPVIARKILECYIPIKGATIFDYSCGFGSRMLGTLASPNHYQYIGVDPYTELCERLLLFSDWIQDTLKNNNKPIILNKESEEFVPFLYEQIDFSFSSPPYFNEIYTDSTTQSYIKYPTYEEWKNNYMKNTILNIYRYTKANGIHAVNLQDTKRISIIEDWIKIATKIGFILEESRTISTVKRKTTKNENKLLIMRKK